MSFNVGTAVGYLDLDTSGFKSGFNSALQDLRAFNDDSATASTKLQAVGTAMTSVGSSMTKYVTTPIVGLGAAFVGISAKFESAMSSVQAISGATGEEFEALKQKAIDLGGSTTFSAQEVAEAMTEMAKAGWDTQQILDGMGGVLDAAAASGESLGTVSTIVADAITGFGLAASDSTRVADLLTQAANSGTIGIGDLGETFKYIAPVANAMGLSIEDVTTAVAAMSMAGIKGSQAGTGLRTMLTNLAKPTDTIATYMDKLNISLTDYNGQIKPLNQLLAEMRVSFQGLTEAEQAEYAAGLAGKEGMSALLSILTLTQEEYDAISESMYNAQGVADETARVMQDNLANKIEQLGGSLESLAIKMGSLLIPTVQSIVEWLTKVVDWFSNLDEGTQKTILTIAAVVAAVGPALLIVGKIITSVQAIVQVLGLLKPAILAVNAAMNSNPIFLIITLIGLLVTALVTLYQKNEAFRNFVDTAWAKIKEVISTVVNAIVTFFTETIPNAIQVVIQWFKDLPENIWNALTTAISNLGKWIVEMALKAQEVRNQIIEKIINFFKELPENIGYALGQVIGAIASWIVNTAKTCAEVGPKVIDAIVNFFKELPGKIWNYLVETATKLAQWVINMATTAQEVRNSIIEKIVNFFKELPSNVWNYLVETAKKLAQWVINMATTAAEVQNKVITAVVNFFKGLPGKIWNHLMEAATKMATWVTDLIAWAKSAIPTVIDTILSFFQELPGKMVEIGKNLLQGLIDGITGAVGFVVDKVKGIGQSILNGFKSTFDIHSPSKETENMGTMLMQGLANGVTGSAATALASVEALSNSLINKLESLVNQIVELMTAAGEKIQSFDLGGEEDQNNITLYSQLVSSLSIALQQMVTVVERLNQAYSSMANFFIELVEAYKYIISSKEQLLSALEAETEAYDNMTKSLKEQIEALKELRALKESSFVADTLSNSEEALGRAPSNVNSAILDNAGNVAGVVGGGTSNTFIFNSPTAVVPTKAASLTQKAIQQASMSIK